MSSSKVSVAAALIAFALLGTTGAGAPQSTTPLAFEVASVKPQTQPRVSLDALSQVEVFAAFMETSPQMRFAGTDRFTARNATVRWLIQRAYGPEYRHPDQIVGGPQWIHQDRFEIEARAAAVLPESVGPDLPAPVAEMLRSLLEERFRLRVRREMRELPVYALVRARADGRLGSAIRPSAVDCADPNRSNSIECIPPFASGGRGFAGRPVEAILPTLESRLGRLVINETGISGNVDIDPVLPLGGAEDQVSRDAAFFSALREHLGLRVESSRASIPVLVIEHVERPSEN